MGGGGTSSRSDIDEPYAAPCSLFPSGLRGWDRTSADSQRYLPRGGGIDAPEPALDRQTFFKSLAVWLVQRSLSEQIPRQCPPEWSTPDSD